MPYDPLAQLKKTIAIDIARFMSAGHPPQAIVTRLFDIPEFSQAFHLYYNRNRPLSVDPGTEDERREIVDAFERVIVWLGEGGFNKELTDELREIQEGLG